MPFRFREGLWLNVPRKSSSAVPAILPPQRTPNPLVLTGELASRTHLSPLRRFAHGVLRAGDTSGTKGVPSRYGELKILQRRPILQVYMWCNDVRLRSDGFTEGRGRLRAPFSFKGFPPQALRLACADDKEVPVFRVSFLCRPKRV